MICHRTKPNQNQGILKGFFDQEVIDIFCLQKFLSGRINETLTIYHVWIVRIYRIECTSHGSWSFRELFSNKLMGRCIWLKTMAQPFGTTELSYKFVGWGFFNGISTLYGIFNTEIWLIFKYLMVIIIFNIVFFKKKLYFIYNLF